MNKVNGIVINVKKIWWIKVKQKPIRIGLNDGVVYPHIVTVKYIVDNIEYESKKYFNSSLVVPKIGDKVIVYYKEKNHSKIIKIS